MSRRLRIVQVNAAFEPSASSPGALLDRYTTLTAWSEAMTRAGAEVAVVQRFGGEATLSRQGVDYRLVADGLPPLLPRDAGSDGVVATVAAARADVVHLNGLMFPRLVVALREALPAPVAIVVQDHAGVAPPWGPAWRSVHGWPQGLDRADAVSFTSTSRAAPWSAAGLLGEAEVIEVIEASTTVVPTPKDRARHLTGLSGDPLVLWVGRLTPGKDPLTVLRGLERALAALPDGRLAMIWQGDAPLEGKVRALIAGSPILAARVTLVGGVPHDEMGRFYGAADVFLSGSHDEGSGYALIEALACGLIPVVTDIAAFRAIAGACGTRWEAGDAASCAAAIAGVAQADRASLQAQVRQQFATHLTWAAIAERTLAMYEAISQRRRVRCGAA